jgi:hypothetical protein
MDLADELGPRRACYGRHRRLRALGGELLAARISIATGLITQGVRGIMGARA